MTGSKELFLEERRQAILQQVHDSGRVSVAALSTAFGVSEVTIRADLQALAERKLVIRTHGGAVPAGGGLYDLALTMRRRRQVQQKERIGAAGAALVEEGEAIILDSSSTALAIAGRLKSCRHLTVITNSLAVAQTFLDAPGVTVVMPGGVLQRDTASLISSDGLAALQRYNIQKGFFGAHGLDLPAGLTDVSAEEAAVKQPLAAMARQVIAVLDASKWGRVGVASFAAPEEIDLVITDRDAPPEQVARLEALGITVRLV